ncbi:MAG: SWIB/MDM2 domain-containing protein [Janthinobacterium lividum]
MPQNMTKAPRKTEAKEPAEEPVETPKPAKKAAPKAEAKAEPKAASKAVPKGKKIDEPAPGSKPNALQQPLQPSDDLAAIIGAGTFPRGQVVSKIWEYIKANKLQSPKDGRQIVADQKLEAVFGKKEVSMFEMNKLISAHLSTPK